MKLRYLYVCAVVVLIAGCSTRSISDSGYSRYGHYGSSPLYRGELSEFDVLGVRTGAAVSDEEIERAFTEAPSRKQLRKGDSILLIQSGATIPDEEMLGHLEKVFSVSVFSGVPEQERADGDSYASSLRLAAAKGGIETIVVYWGVLESGTENLATKTVSWLPIVGRAVPDESQHMRIRLKIAVVDVRSGHWEIFTPATHDDTAYSARLTRRGSDQSQVASLKTAAYADAAEELIARVVQ